MIQLILIIFTIAADQISKYVISSNYELHDSFPIIKNILNMTYITNKGAALGILANQRWIFISVSCVALVIMSGILVYIIRLKKYYLMQNALALILGGGLGNMIDRLYLGHVVDFLEFDFVNFAVFNLADTFISVGAVLFCIALFRDRNNLFPPNDEEISCGDEMLMFPNNHEKSSED